MTTFSVNPQSLAALGLTLIGIHDHMQGLKSSVSGYDGALGGSDVDSHVSGFCSHWNYGTGKLAQHMQDVLTNLEQATKNYAQNKQNIKAAATPAGR